MTGELIDDTVVIREQKEGSQLYNKGNYGYPRSGGGLDLDLVEATYLVECRRLEVVRGKERMNFEDLFRYSASMHEGFDIKYMVYRDLRQRGFVVKLESGDYDLSIFPRGKTMSNSVPSTTSSRSPRGTPSRSPSSCVASTMPRTGRRGSCTA